MFNHGQTCIRVNAQVGAQKGCDNILGSEQISRKEKLDLLQSAGQFRCFINDDGLLEPSAYGKIVSEEGDSWTWWSVYNLSEVQEFLRLSGREELLDAKEDLDMGEPCPDCGEKDWREERGDGTRCGGCGNWYSTREDRLDDLATLFEGTGRAYYSGPGRRFAHEPIIKQGRNRILVKQHGGLDI